LAGSFIAVQSDNNVSDVQHKEHNYTYGLNATLTPKDRFSLQLGWDTNDILSRTNVCFVSTPAPPGAIKCALATTFLSAVSTYSDMTHFVFGNVIVRPVKRAAAGLGYSFIRNDGSSLILNPNQPPGTLQFDYHRPDAFVDIGLPRDLAFHAGWNFYDYKEQAFLGFTTPRDFHAHLATLSLRYAF
jgi:hypothetical protein